MPSQKKPTRTMNDQPAEHYHYEPHLGWDSPSYERLLAHGLLRTEWRKSSFDELNFKEGNASAGYNAMRRAAAILFPPAACFLSTAEVPAGSIRKMDDGRGGFCFLGNRGRKQGVHAYWDMFYRIDKQSIALNEVSPTAGLVVHNGDCWIVVVPQGFVGMATDMGQPVLLPPGMHQWKSSTMKFESNIDLNQPVIHLGPYTLLTVDMGYEAVTQNNGKQEVLPGGAVHLLNHRNWKFEKFITRKIQTDNLQRIEVMTGDNVLMHVDATVLWSIDNVQMCAERAAETMAHKGNSSTGTIDKLRNDVLKQAEASLSALVGKVNFSNTFSAATALQAGQRAIAQGRALAAEASAAGPSDDADAASSPEGLAAAAAAAAAAMAPSGERSGEVDPVALLFDVDKVQCAVGHANEMTTRYGVLVLSINIISAKPADKTLMQCLAKGAVAAAEAQQLETIARGRAKAAAIDARGNADALKISAQADAEAEVTRAQGSKQAAELLNEQDVAVQLATIAATGHALAGANSNLIMGGDPSNISGMLMSNSDFTRNTLGMQPQQQRA